MEDILSEYREGKLNVTREVVTVLFDCLDTLEKMVRNIEDGNEEIIEIDSVIQALESVAKLEEFQEDKEVLEEESFSENENIDINLNQYDISVIEQAKSNGFNGVITQIFLREDTLLKSARAFLIFQELERQGEVIKSFPTTEDIENELRELVKQGYKDITI